MRTPTAHLREEATADLAELLRLSSLEQGVHVAASLVAPHQLAEAVEIQLPLKARVLVLCNQHRNNILIVSNTNTIYIDNDNNVIVISGSTKIRRNNSNNNSSNTTTKLGAWII